MRPHFKQRFMFSARYARYNQTTQWSDELLRTKNMKTEDLVMEYRGVAVSGKWPEGNLVFVVRRDNHDGTVSDEISRLSMPENFFSDNYGDTILIWEGVELEPARNTRFPHQCTSCGHDAYIGGQNNCECSNSNCRLYYNNPRY